MTEAEWLECSDPYPMLEFLRDKVSDRKFRLFAVACCHRPYYQVAHKAHREAVRLAERMADEDVDEAEWRVVHQAALELWRSACAESEAAQLEAPRGTPEVERLVDADMATAAGWAILEDAWEAAYQVTGVEWVERDERYADEPGHQIALLHDIIGNPFRPVSLEPAWRTPAVLHLAQSIYDDWAFDQLPILADALKEAGCASREVLDHCRSPGPHVRGCWVVDLVLGKG
jgi:hypothetical protein